MIRKKQGTINELIYNRTVYNEGNTIMFLDLSELTILIKEIKELKVTTQCISFTPWYTNPKLKSSICFDEYEFCLEARELLDSPDMVKLGVKYFKKIFGLSKRNSVKDKYLYEVNFNPVCHRIDVRTFHKYLDSYIEYLNELIPIMFNDVIEKHHLTDDDLAFGYFCFEIHNR